jgi:hypothetical protein
VDDAHDGYDIIVEVLRRIEQNPDQYVWVAGNHCEATYYDGDRFTASCKPAGFADWLNDKGTVELGKAYVQLVEQLPRAIFFPKGLMCSHAAFPHDDVSNELLEQQKMGASALQILEAMEDTSTETGRKSQQDFVWGRIATKKKSLVFRGSKSIEVGALNFNLFSNAVEILAEITGRKLNWIVRGHDHPSSTQYRWFRPNDLDHKFANRHWKSRYLTVTNQSFEMRGAGKFLHTYPVVARWNSNESTSPFPQPTAIIIPESLVHQYAPLCTHTNHTSNPQYVGQFFNSMDATVCQGMIKVGETEDGEEIHEPCGRKLQSSFWSFRVK